MSMSIATMNWALQQRLESPALQALLYVIADSADPNGMTRHCDPKYMADRARMSRPTVFRRIGELEKFGLLTRFKFYTERGAPIYEIRLQLEAFVDQPIKGRRTADEDDLDDDSEEIAASETELNDRPKSQVETLVAPTKVSPGASPKSHCGDSISPTTSKNLPPTPLRGGSLTKSEVEQGEKREAWGTSLRQNYPSIGAMDPGEARNALDELSLDDAEWAIASVPHYAAELRKNDWPPKKAHIWLRKRMFENFARGTPPPPSAAEQVWVAEGSQEDRAVRFLRGLSRAVMPFVMSRPEGGKGYPLKAAVGADALAMLAFADDNEMQWKPVLRGTDQFAAWQERFVSWTGRPLAIVRLHDDGYGIRVPGPWPPKKDGTLYRDDDAHFEDER
jgi:hypothetical protein